MSASYDEELKSFLTGKGMRADAYFLYLLGDRHPSPGVMKAWEDGLSTATGIRYTAIAVYQRTMTAEHTADNHIIVGQAPRGFRGRGSYRGLPKTLPPTDFNARVRDDAEVRRVLELLARRQRDVPVVGLTQNNLNFGIDNIKHMGPHPELAEDLSSKRRGFEIFQELGLLKFGDGSPFRVELFDTYRKMKRQAGIFADPKYVALDNAAAGRNSGKIATPDDLKALERELFPRGNLKKARENANTPVIASQFVEEVGVSPMTNVLVGKSGDVRVLMISDQIMNGNSFCGMKWPSILSKEQQDEVEASSLKVGHHLAGLGFRGIFSVDFILTMQDEKFAAIPVDLNPRRGGSYEGLHIGLHNAQTPINVAEVEARAIYGLRNPDFNLADLSPPASFATGKLAAAEKGVYIVEKVSPAITADGAFDCGTQHAIFYPRGTMGREVGSIFTTDVGGSSALDVLSKTNERLISEALSTPESFEASWTDSLVEAGKRNMRRIPPIRISRPAKSGVER